MNTDKNIYINDLSEILQSSGCPIVPSKLKDNDVIYIPTTLDTDGIKVYHRDRRYQVDIDIFSKEATYLVLILKTTTLAVNGIQRILFLND